MPSRYKSRNVRTLSGKSLCINCFGAAVAILMCMDSHNLSKNSMSAINTDSSTHSAAVRAIKLPQLFACLNCSKQFFKRVRSSRLSMR